MNRIKTTDILDPSIQQPFTGLSLDFLQNATKEIILGLVQAIIGESYDIANPYVLKGLSAYGTNQYLEGYILWNEEVYYCAGKSTITAFVNVPVLTITVTNDATADPVTFTDLVPRSVHNNRKLVLSDAVSGTGTFDLSDAIYLKTDWIAVSSFNASWVAGSGLQAPRYKLDNGYIVLSGHLDNVSSPLNQLAFTLPVGFRPPVTNVFTASGSTTFAAVNYIVIASSGQVTINYTGTSGVSLDNIRIPID